MHKLLTTVILVSLTQTVPFSSPNTSSVLSQVTSGDPPIDLQLPNNIVPNSYEIKLNPNFDDEEFTFYGESKINIRVEKPTNVITLHAKELDIKSGATVNCDSINDINVSSIEPIDTTTDFLKIILEKELQAGLNCNLTLKYSGTGNEEYKNLYRASYKTDHEQQKWLASTSSLLSNARNIFPCWDEPALRGNFILSIEHNKNYVALSNMHVDNQEENPKDSRRKITHFAPSPKMSAGSLTFTIGNFTMVNGSDEKFRVWTLPHLIRNGNYALRVGRKLLAALENYMDYTCKDQGIGKIDSIVVPIIQGFTAESSWGLVKYQRWGLLLDENSTRASKKEYVTKVMAHELSHQWFGNLVTADWYDYIWLNEGFANYFQYAIPDQIEPTWRIMDRYVLENIQSMAFVYDSRINSHPMEQVRRSPNEITNAYDAITYKKSGSVIRMISHVLGEEKFKSGLRSYLKTKAFAAVVSDDLFKEFAKVNPTNTNLLGILKNWVSVPGYPLVTVTRDYEGGKAIITQSRFLDKINATSDEKYWIPINFATEDQMNFTDTSVTHWFDPLKNSIEIDGLQSNQFLILNKQLFGYYRVNYDSNNWALITSYLRTEKYTNIHELNRAQLIDDALNLAKVGHLKYNVVLSLIGYLKKETEFIPWSAAWKVIESIHILVANTEFNNQFKEYVLELSENLVNEVLTVQLDQVDYITNLKRLDALKWACFYGSNSCQSEARNKLIKWLDDSEINALTPDDQNWLICAGLQNADQTTWNRLWEKYVKTSDKNILLQLGCSSDIGILKTFLSNSIAKNPIFMQLSLLFMIIYEKSANGPTAILEFIIEQYDEIIALNGYSKDRLQDELITLDERLTNRTQHQKLKQFIENNRALLNNAAVKALEADRNNLGVVRNNRLNEFREFFEKNSTKPSDDSIKNDKENSPMTISIK